MQFWQIGGVVPWPAVLAPGDEVAKVIGKPPLIRNGGDGRATEASVLLRDGNGDLDGVREMDGRIVSSLPDVG